MGLVSRLFGAEYRSGLANPAGWLVDALGGAKSHSGKKVTVEGALGLAPLFAAVSIISETVGMLPLKVYHDLGDGMRVEARGGRPWLMLHDAPNPVTTADRFWSAVTAQLLLWGNAFVYMQRGDGGLVEELWLLDPATTTVEWNPRTREKRFIQEPFELGASRRTFSDREVVHIFGFSINGLVGESPIARCRQSIGTALAREEFEGTFYRDGARPVGFLMHPDTLTDGANKRLRKDWKRIYGGKFHDVAVLEEGMKFQPLTMPLKDLEFVASQQLSRTDIAVLFRLPPSYLGGSTGESLTYETVEGNQIQFAQLAVAPPANTIAKALGNDSGIFPLRTYYPEHVFEGLLRADTAGRAAMYSALAALESITVNEIRGRENMPPLPGGDQTPGAIGREHASAQLAAQAALEAKKAEREAQAAPAEPPAEPEPPAGE